MMPIIPPILTSELEKELTREKFVRVTNKGQNIIYDFAANEAPLLMREVGRLRELTFRSAGGGTGLEVDIDEYDVSDHPYRQLIVWDPIDKEILGGYRYIIGDKVKIGSNGVPELATTEMFHFSETFIKEYLPYTIELGRSFVQPQYQSSKAGAKALYALDNLWDGLGALVIENPSIKYFFGKVTMYTHFNRTARDLILSFMNKYFEDKERLVYPYEPVQIGLTENELKQIFVDPDFVDDYKVLVKRVRDFGENIPPLVNAYMTLSPSMRSFGTAINTHFGDVEETGIIITIKELYKDKTDRHMNTYNRG
ncbi:MAG: GNAT family N-acetyltransferase [Breznakibacter sp.]|nr:GNAT family N-acetyltransferase [Breznakibacter sp.]